MGRDSMTHDAGRREVASGGEHHSFRGEQEITGDVSAEFAVHIEMADEASTQNHTPMTHIKRYAVYSVAAAKV